MTARPTEARSWPTSAKKGSGKRRPKRQSPPAAPRDRVRWSPTARKTSPTRWVRYAEDVVRHTAEASRALLSARTFGEMLEVQAKLMRDNREAFLDQSARIAKSAGRLASRPFEALSEVGSDQTRP